MGAVAEVFDVDKVAHAVVGVGADATQCVGAAGEERGGSIPNIGGDLLLWLAKCQCFAGDKAVGVVLYSMRRISPRSWVTVNSRHRRRRCLL